MTGLIVKHGGFGIGKVFSSQNGQLTVLFLAPEDVKTIAGGVGGRNALKRVLLPLNTLCDTQDRKQCRITNTIPSANSTEPHRYQVEFDDGLAREVSELDLIPKDIPFSDSPLEALAERQLEGLGTFLKREALAEAWHSSERGALGLRALLSSRIDLRSHQAYVAGTILTDRTPRYLLADEVGLGKTIEAGIIIHDLMETNPSAKILILCPATLTQQWLCELYAKFSGRVFHLLELRLIAAQNRAISDKVVVSFPDSLSHASMLLETKWDMIVVDEAHHLLSTPKLYLLAQQLSKIVPAFLLLSAIPAQHREEEYLRLLALLEPQRYNPNAAGERERFKQLYDRQIEIGRKLSYISRRLTEFSTTGEGAERILQKIAELNSLPILSQDGILLASTRSLDPSNSAKFIEEVRALVHHVGDRYRISRRILRNRRSQLFDLEPSLRIERKLNRLPHHPDQMELDAGSAVRRLLQSLSTSGVHDSVLMPLARHLFHSLCDPTCLNAFVALADSSEQVCTDDLLEFDGQVSYHTWEEYASSIWAAAGPSLREAEMRDLQRAAETWLLNNDESSTRIDSLITFLRQRHKRRPAQKVLIFAGFFGLTDRLARALVNTFGNSGVARFAWDMETKAKEKEVLRFRRDSNCWLMISDETGGEGRNFQFVDELVHFDLPWHVSKIEQRIGRLDRLGRKNPEVYSNVHFAMGEEEEGLLNCLESGFQVFTNSISGLEFALTKLERRIAQTAITEGCEGLILLVEEIKKDAEAERAEDDVQGMLDAASLDRRSAEVFRRAQSTPERDIALESAFCDWFRFIAGNGAMAFPPTGELPDKSIVEFRPNQLPKGTLPLVTGPDAIQPDRLGTFRRQIAQERPDLEFFSIGNEFFDAIGSSFRQSIKGRTYAVECLTTHAPWRGFEFSYRPVGNRSLLLPHPGLIKHLDRVFAVRTEHCFIGEDLKSPADNLEILAIRKTLSNETKDEIWRNFTLNNTRVQLLADYYANPGWEQLVHRAETIARQKIKAHFSLILGSALEAEQTRIAEQIRQAQVAGTVDCEDEIAGLKALMCALNEWDVELDIAGFLSLSGGIIP